MRITSKGHVTIPGEIPLQKEPFVGMWENREDMAESTEWVRRTRQREWTRR